MKFFAQLAIVATLLFAASAALSLWLRQQPDVTTEKEKDKDRPAKKAERDPDRSDRENTQAKQAPKITEPPPISTDPTATALREREDRLARRAAQVDLILKDLQAEREAVDALLKQVNAELKVATAKAGELEAKAADLSQKKTDLEGVERKNVERIAGIYDSMPAESAALILKQMADSGRLDTAVKVLSQMKDRQAAKVLAELNDPTLASQLVERLRSLKVGPTTPAAPATGTTPNLPARPPA